MYGFVPVIVTQYTVWDYQFFSSIWTLLAKVKKVLLCKIQQNSQ